MAAQIVVDTYTTEIAELRKQLTVESAELSQLSAQHGELTDKLSLVDLPNLARPVALENLKSVERNCELSDKRAMVSISAKSRLLELLWRRSLPCWLNGRTTTIAVKR